MGDLSRRKDEQHAAAFKPVEGLPHGADIGANRSAAVERIDRDGQIAQLGDPIQKKVRHDFHIGPAAQENVRHDDAFNSAERMVANDDGRAFLRDILQILRFDLRPDIHVTEGFVHERMPIAMRLDPIIQCRALPQAEQMFQRTCDDLQNLAVLLSHRFWND